ncbi:uncharacterized protein LOC120188151 [Hibiscus syriacus]|uniref:uncharacterized protein LOC120188151 n=1 Tax=Hibiscus syriacus TaxID=106335 RepID=UPI001923ECF1|nr:uncharacterized protein LOC120188151 [Hibiscus syriacus]
MEQGKGTKSSSSVSPFADLFGPKVSPSSTSNILESIFPPPPKVPRGQYLVTKKKDSPYETLKTKPGDSGNPSKGHEGAFQSAANEEVDSIYPQQCVNPCSLSSSIFYGGQDECPIPQAYRGTGINSMFKDDEEDDKEYATRGDWWQGSLYY